MTRPEHKREPHSAMNRPVDRNCLLLLLPTLCLAFARLAGAAEILPDVIEASQVTRDPQTLRWAIDLFFIGSLLMIGCYHLVFYSFRRTNIAIFYYGAYCVLWAINFLVTYGTNSALSLFLPGIPGAILQRCEQIAFLATVPVGYLFFRLRFPQEFPQWIIRPIVAVYGAFILWALLAPIANVLIANALIYLISFSLIIMTIVFLSRAFRAHREGAGIFLIGFAILGCIGTNDMLYDLHLIQTIYLMPLGMSLFIFAQSSALSKSFARAFSAVENLSADLEGKNLSLHEQMEERIRLEAEIVNLSENERRHLSHELHDGLCQQITAARLYCDVLKEDMSGHSGGLQIAQLSQMLTESVDHAYNLSRGLWPVDLDPIGMSTFLESFCNRIAASKGIAVDIQQQRVCSQCDNENIAQLYRIAQEAITNAVKHSDASLIEVRLDCRSRPGLVSLSVRDNGIGRCLATQTSGGLGTRIMVHRAQIIGGQLEINDAAGGGTEVRCEIHCTHCFNNLESD